LLRGELNVQCCTIASSTTTQLVPACPLICGCTNTGQIIEVLPRLESPHVPIRKTLEVVAPVRPVFVGSSLCLCLSYLLRHCYSIRLPSDSIITASTGSPEVVPWELY